MMNGSAFTMVFTIVELKDAEKEEVHDNEDEAAISQKKKWAQDRCSR